MSEDPVMGLLQFGTLALLVGIMWRIISRGARANRAFWRAVAGRYQLELAPQRPRYVSRGGLPRWLEGLEDDLNAELPEAFPDALLRAHPGMEANGTFHAYPLRFAYFELHFWSPSGNFGMGYGNPLPNRWLYVARLKLDQSVPDDCLDNRQYQLYARGDVLYLVYRAKPEPTTCLDPIDNYLQSHHLI